MFRRKAEVSAELRCSFCHKPEGAVGKLIGNPSDYQRAFICDECVNVCQIVLDDERPDTDATPPPDSPRAERAADANPMVDAGGNLNLRNSRTSKLFAAMSAWVACEEEGLDASQELAEVRRLAMLIFGKEPGTL